MMTDLITPLILTAAIILAYPLLSVYLVLLERKVLADFQVRLGPMRVGPHGLLQPLADALKLVLKEDIIPRNADRAIFWAAPVVATFSALTAFAVLPLSQKLYVADINVGLLFISAMGAIGILGIILGGWASNSHYSLLGALRASAQLVSYEVALSLALLAPVMAAGSLSMVQIVESQQNRGIWFAFDNFGLMIVPFVIFLISAIAEVNRVPFDLPEAEAELVAGFHTEYSGFRWAMFMLGESASTFVVCCVAATLFLGGWLRPFPNIHWLTTFRWATRLHRDPARRPRRDEPAPSLAPPQRTGKNRPDRVRRTTHYHRTLAAGPGDQPGSLRPLLVLREGGQPVLRNGLAPRHAPAFPL